MRISIALRPPTKKNTPIPTRYWIADDLVVGAQAEVAADALALALVLGQRRRVAEHPPDRVVGEPEADQEADHPEQVAEQDRDVVLAGLVE